MGNPNAVPPPPRPENMWKKGQSGNPKGRKKGIPDVRTQIKELFGKKKRVLDPLTGNHKSQSIQRQVILAQIGRALKGDTKAFNSLIDRLEGKAVQPISGPDGEALLSAPPQIILRGVSPDEVKQEE